MSQHMVRMLSGLIVVANAIATVFAQNPSDLRTFVKDYRVFYDNQREGYGTIFGSLLVTDDSVWLGVFSGGGKYQDDEIGMLPFSIRTADNGHSWSKPETFARQLLEGHEGQSLVMRVFGPTKKGTIIAIGYQYQNDTVGNEVFEDTQWRSYQLIIGRREKGESDFTYRRFPSASFLGEQFVEGGLQLPDGRIVLTIWGAKHHGENWRCGVLLSDDDGKVWKYRDVAYEPDRSIRDKSGVVAGFNEQTLFLTHDGTLVSIIRGREKLGRVPTSSEDTWFFRSESRDHGETWSYYEPTDLVGTGGAFGTGITLSDGSLLQACRVPYARNHYQLPDQKLFGLHIVRSFDLGRSWRTEHVIQYDPEGKPFKDYYNVMNGQFVETDDGTWLYQFGQFDKTNQIYRILSLSIHTKDERLNQPKDDT